MDNCIQEHIKSSKKAHKRLVPSEIQAMCKETLKKRDAAFKKALCENDHAALKRASMPICIARGEDMVQHKWKWVDKQHTLKFFDWSGIGAQVGTLNSFNGYGLTDLRHEGEVNQRMRNAVCRIAESLCMQLQPAYGQQGWKWCMWIIRACHEEGVQEGISVHEAQPQMVKGLQGTQAWLLVGEDW